MSASTKIVRLYDYADEGGRFLEMKTEAWVQHRLISGRVERIGENQVRLCNRPARVIRDKPGLPSERPWGVASVGAPLWVPLQGER